MSKFSTLFLKIVTLFFLFFIVSCETIKPLPTGIQAGYEAINPAGIIAVPVFILPDPSGKGVIDSSILASSQIVFLLQKKINDAFLKQPNIHGYSFDAVSKALGPNSSILKNLNAAISNISKRFSATDSTTRSLITSSCLSRKNFIEFYSYCLIGDPVWMSNLNTLSGKIMNADAALFVFITDLESTFKDGVYKNRGDFSVLLVDTNNGKLMWGNNVTTTIVNPKEKQYFPSWSVLVDKSFPENFWNSFPGRIGRK